VIVNPKIVDLFRRIGEARGLQLPIVLSPDDLETLISVIQGQTADFNQAKDLAETANHIIESYKKLLEESKAREERLKTVAEEAVEIAKKLGNTVSFDQLYKPVGKA
jgi:sugar/nucleoside kinase (ribokinase family)